MPGNKTVGGAKQGCPLKGGKVLVVVKETGGLSVDGFALTLADLNKPPAYTGKVVVDKKGKGEYRAVPEGAYALGAAPPDVLTGLFHPAGSVSFRVSAGARKLVQVAVVAKKKKVSATLSAAATSTWCVPPGAEWPPLVVDLTLTEDLPEVAFRGTGKLRRTANLEVYYEPECRTALVFDKNNDAVIPNGFLTQKPSLKLYVRARAAGAASLGLTLVPGDRVRDFVTVGDASTLELTVKEANVVQGVVEPEVPVIALAPAHAGERPDTDPPLATGATKIVLGITETGDEVPYDKDAKLFVSNPEVKLFTDAELKTPLVLDGTGRATLETAKLTKGNKIALYARATTAGTARLSLELEAVTAEGIRVDPPPPVEVGLVQLQAEVWRWKDGETPVEEKLSPQALGRRGRLVHVQDDKGNHGRAKVVVKKLDATQWPKEAKALTLVVGAQGASGAVKLFTKEKGGTEQTLPYALVRKDLDKGDVTLWVEGATESDAARSVTLSVGIGAAKDDPKLLKNAFWAPFTVVKVEAVKPVSEFTTPTAEYPAGNLRQYVNLALDPEGRKVEVRAKLSKPLVDVDVAFGLFGDEKNGKSDNNGVDRPSKWKAHDPLEAKDRTDTGEHRHGLTQAGGLVDAELVLSRHAGDKFRIAAFVVDDAPLGQRKNNRSVTGREPVMSEPIQVWTKLWYQLTHVKTANIPEPDLSVAAYAEVRCALLPGERVKVEKGAAPAGTYYPTWMVQPGGPDAEISVIGGHNKAAFFAHLVAKPEEPLKANVVVCDAQWDPARTDGGAPKFTDTVVVEFKPGQTQKRVDVGLSIVKPAFVGNLVNTSQVTLVKEDGTQQDRGTITDDWISIPKDRTSTTHVVVTLPDALAKPTGKDSLKVAFRLRAVAGPYLGESDGRNILAVYDPSEAADFNDTISHEIGHSLNQTPRVGREPACLPEHPQQVDHGQGNHCTDKACIMYESGPQKSAKHRFCSVCRPYLVAQDFSRWT